MNLIFTFLLYHGKVFFSWERVKTQNKNWIENKKKIRLGGRKVKMWYQKILKIKQMMRNVDINHWMLRIIVSFECCGILEPARYTVMIRNSSVFELLLSSERWLRFSVFEFDILCLEYLIAYMPYLCAYPISDQDVSHDLNVLYMSHLNELVITPLCKKKWYWIPVLNSRFEI